MGKYFGLDPNFSAMFVPEFLLRVYSDQTGLFSDLFLNLFLLSNALNFQKISFTNYIMSRDCRIFDKFPKYCKKKLSKLAIKTEISAVGDLVSKK